MTQISRDVYEQTSFFFYVQKNTHKHIFAVLTFDLSVDQVTNEADFEGLFGRTTLNRNDMRLEIRLTKALHNDSILDLSTKQRNTIEPAVAHLPTFRSLASIRELTSAQRTIIDRSDVFYRESFRENMKTLLTLYKVL